MSCLDELTGDITLEMTNMITDQLTQNNQPTSFKLLNANRWIILYTVAKGYNTHYRQFQADSQTKATIHSRTVPKHRKNEYLSISHHSHCSHPHLFVYKIYKTLDEAIQS
jgi:hypothetical protein